MSNTVVATANNIVASPPLQTSVDRFIRGMETQAKLLALHPRAKGNPGNAGALPPAIVLGAIAAFEGFAEDFTALMMADQGSSFAEIAKKIGRWNNPTLQEFSSHMRTYFGLSSIPLANGPAIELFAFPYPGQSKPVPVSRAWSDALIDSAAWMQVRHLLTHGLTTGWRQEWWPGPLHQNEPPASQVLRDVGGGKHALGVYGAINCARVYSLGAKHAATTVAEAYGHSLDWSKMPTFQ